MSGKPFHLGWFGNFTMTADWSGDFTVRQNNWDGKFYVEMAQALERACFDYFMLEDTLMVAQVMGGSMEVALRNAIGVPKHDPLPLAALIGAATSRLGVVATMSTLAYPPFLLARLAATMNHICNGRFGWNIVTTSAEDTAENFGVTLPPREQRYDMADEYVSLVCKLLEAWEPDSVIVNEDKGVYADHTKVHAVNFEGKFFKSKGPLNTAPSPHGRPVFVQAGGSPRGRVFAAQTADSVIATANGVAGMKAYRDDVRAKAVAAGRNPDDIKVLFLAYPYIGDTKEEAAAKRERMISSPNYIQNALVGISAITNIDFTQFDLDKPVPELTTTGEQGALEKFVQPGSGKTLRELVRERFDGGLELVGTPGQIADQMGEVMAGVGGDGFLISAPFRRMSRRYLAEVTEGLVPALQRRGLTRTAYAHSTLRETLREF